MSKKKGNHIFGMTGPQLAILAILSLIAIGVIYGGFIFISSTSRPGGISLIPTSEPTFSPPSAMEATPDLTDITGLSLTATLSPDGAQIPADWKLYDNSRIQLRVPPQFNSVDPAAQRQERINFFRTQGSEALASQLENEIFEYRFWFNFSQPESVAFVTSISVKADFLPTETLAEYVDETYGAGIPGYEIVNRQQYPIEGLEAERVIMVVNLNDVSLGVAEYVVTDGVNLWVVSCWSNFDEFYTWLPEFDRVADSFHLLY